MKQLVVLLLAVIALLAIRFFKNYTRQIILAFLICITIVSGFFMLRDIGGLTDFIRPYNQLYYQSEFLKDGLYSDAILPLMVKDKTVYVKDDLEDIDLSTFGPDHWEAHLDEIHYGVNTESLLNAFGANVKRDESLNDIVVTDDIQKDFEDFGSANDMLRFSGAVGNIEEKYGNFFHHQYIFYSKGQPLHIYLHLNDKGSLISGTDDELVVLWQKKDEGFGEDIYIMDKEYCDDIK